MCYFELDIIFRPALYISFERMCLTDKKEGSLNLVCNDKMAFLLLNNLNDINYRHVRKCVMLFIIFWTVYL